MCAKIKGKGEKRGEEWMQDGRIKGRSGWTPAAVLALSVHRFVRISVKTSAALCLPVMAQGQGVGQATPIQQKCV